MEDSCPFHLYSARYRHAGRVCLAHILAADERQATTVLWQEVMAESPLLAGSGATLAVEEIEDMGPAAQAVPYPEVLPDQPALLSVVVL